jgi:CMP-N,N'-diacetyllegionaminic acid synthase
LANDTAKSIDVIIHALDFFKKNNEEFEYVVLLQPTSPLRTENDIDNAFEMLSHETKAVISVCEAEHSPLWANTLPDNFSMIEFIRPEWANLRSQDLPKYYRLNGAIYISVINYLIEKKGFLGDNTKAYIMPQDRSIDIDTELDFKLCVFLINEDNWNKTKN